MARNLFKQLIIEQVLSGSFEPAEVLTIMHDGWCGYMNGLRECDCRPFLHQAPKEKTDAGD